MTAFPHADGLSQIPALWKWSALTGLLLALAAAPVQELPSWMAVIPIVIGIVIGLFLCHRAGETPEMKDFRSDFWLRLCDEAKSAKGSGQLDFFQAVVPEAAERKRVFRMQTDHGPLYIVSAERFQDLLVSRATDDIDRATEHALGVAWRSMPATIKPELGALLRDRVRDVIKNDMRGSIVKLLSHVGERVLDDLEESVEEQAQSEPFKLEPMPARKPRKQASGRP